jgi:hypothetical protein
MLHFACNQVREREWEWEWEALFALLIPRVVAFTWVDWAYPFWERHRYIYIGIDGSVCITYCFLIIGIRSLLLGILCVYLLV